MTTYEAGTVAVATVNGVPDVRVMRVRAASPPAAWVTAEHLPGCGAWWNDADLTDIRPLVVLDLGDDAEDAASQLRQFDRAQGGGYCFTIRDRIADQIEAQTKPPRIPEPGLWGVVTFDMSFKVPGASSSSGWAVRRLTDGDGDWQDGAGNYWAWADLENPVLIRDGIEDES